MNGDFVGRNSSGVATTSQNLGTNAIPWGTSYINSLILGGSAVDASLLTAPKNRIVSGALRTASNQPQFIDPAGSSASFDVTGASVNLVLDINGTAVTVSTDITKGSLTVGPSTTATCAIDEALAADQSSTRTWGERGSDNETITVDAMGAEFQGYIGSYAIISIAGVATEYALAFIKSTTEITDCYRGWFTDSSGNPVNRTGVTNNDVITVLSTGWVFVENDGTTVDVTYTNPIRSFTSPTSPSTGDYWYDLDPSNATWKRYDGSTWQIISRTLIGVVGIDATNCVCARSFDFYADHSNDNTIELLINTTSIVDVKNKNSMVKVYGNEIKWNFSHEDWNITTDLAATTDLYTATEQASTIYFCYVKDTGAPIISDIDPQWRSELYGWYNPQNPWRCVGVFYNDGSSNITIVDEVDYNPNIQEKNVVLYDEKPSSTAGGTFTSGAWRTRTIDHMRPSDSELVTVASNAFRCITGKWRVRWKCPAYGVNKHKSKLDDTTNSIDRIGSSNTTNAADNVQNISHGYEEMVITKMIDFEIQHYCQTTRASEGFGSVAGLASVVENFTIVEIFKVKRVM